jgi:polysaccharide export outer membrane protein
VALRIGIGDLVRVSIWEAGSGGLFSSSSIAGVAAGSANANIPDQIVGSDGAITVPYAGRVRVAGQSPEAVERTIVTRLTGKAIEPQVLVTVTRGVSSTVTVTGDVAAGAQIPLMPNGQRVLDIIALAGGLRGPAHETMVALKRGNRTVEVPFTKLARSPSENIFMRPNDTLILSRRPMTFVALGATGANAEIPMGEESIVLTNAIAKAGGLLDFRADASGVFILRREMSSNVLAVRPNSRLALSGPEVNVVYKVDMRDPRHLVAAQTFHVRMGDVLYVPNAFAADAQKVLNLFNTTVAPVVTGISAANAAQSLAN